MKPIQTRFIIMHNRSLLLFALFFVAGARAEIYRWVDENGVTVYSRRPPANAEAQTVKEPPPPAADPEAAQQELDGELQQMDDYLEDREMVQEQRGKEKATKQLSAANCRKARDNLENLDAASRRLIRMPDGSYVRLTEEQRQEYMVKARTGIEEFCK